MPNIRAFLLAVRGISLFPFLGSDTNTENTTPNAHSTH